MNTTENKKAISKFMNYANGRPLTDDLLNLLYNDWNSLMEVVEKIETLPDEKFQVEINGIWCNFFDMKTFKSVEFRRKGSESKIENCFEAVVSFVNWYNDKTILFWEQDFNDTTL